MKIIKAVLTTFKFIFIGVLAIALLFNLISIFKRVALKEQIPLVMGYGNAIIITGSMEPSINIMDVIIIHKQTDYEPGDIVTYRSNIPITHRILEKTSDGYITQGDANNTQDPEVNKNQIIGKVIKIVPKAGNVILFFQKPFGMLILILCLFAMIEAPRLIDKIRKSDHINKNAKHL